GRCGWAPRGTPPPPGGPDPQVLPFAPAVLPQGEPEALPHPRSRRVGGGLPQDPDAGHLPRLRGRGGEHRQEEGEGQRHAEPNGMESHGTLLLSPWTSWRATGKDRSCSGAVEQRIERQIGRNIQYHRIFRLIFRQNTITSSLQDKRM